MKLLLMDACGAGASLALADSGHSPAVFAQSVLKERSAAAQLVSAVRDLLAGAQLAPGDLDAIAVVHGPGSFTGVRIGVSAAKGLSEGAGRPVIAISRLAVLASLCPSERVHPVLDAGRGEFYVGSYRGLECLREDLLTHEELCALIAGAPGVVCACEAHVAERLHELEPCVVAEPVAADAFALACAAFTAKAFADVATLDGNYLRRADAEMLEKQRAAAAAKANERIIRRAVASDVDALLALERGVPEAAHWSTAEYLQILHPEKHEAALQRWVFIAEGVAEESGELLGFIVVKLLRAGQQTLAEIENLAVPTKARRRGTGSALCAAALEACSAAGAQCAELEVRAGNRAAIGLYTRLGFEQAGVRAGYYANPKEDAVLLRISLQKR